MKFIILIVFTFLISCNDKEGSTIVIGTVVDLNNKIVSNQPIILTSHDFFSIMSPSRTILTTITDGYGKYSFSFEADKGYFYKVIALETNCYFDREADINKGSKNTVDLKLGLKGVVKLKLNSSLIGDSIYYKLTSQNGGYLYSTGYMITEYHTSKDALILDVGVNQNTIIKWFLYTNIGRIQDSISLRPNQCDTLTYEIK